jgi:hypothetical protein
VVSHGRRESANKVRDAVQSVFPNDPPSAAHVRHWCNTQHYFLGREPEFLPPIFIDSFHLRPQTLLAEGVLIQVRTFLILKVHRRFSARHATPVLMLDKMCLSCLLMGSGARPSTQRAKSRLKGWTYNSFLVRMLQTLPSHVHAHCPNHVHYTSRAGELAVTSQYARATSTVCQQPCRCVSNPETRCSNRIHHPGGSPVKQSGQMVCIGCWQCRYLKIEVRR